MAGVVSMLWDSLVAQVYVIAAQMCAASALLIACAVFALVAARKYEKDRMPELANTAYSVVGVLFGVAAPLLFMAAARVINPTFYALKLAVRLVK